MPHGKPPKVVRCAIYTRKSTTEGLDSDFNTLDAQRESAEHYIKSQAAQGWTVVPARYDDGGFTGGNMERPALTRLIDDLERGDVDIVVVYKVDRLSRSLLDFARLIERFEKRGVGLVAVTQHLDTSTSMGRLTLNILLIFAQFEREIISERTRDKIAAARRRGKWTGGPLILGYRVDRERRALEIIPEEAEVVRLAFELYLRTRSIGLTAKRLNARGFKQKKHVSKAGREVGGRPWDKNTVHRLLRNPLYVGKVRQGRRRSRARHAAPSALRARDHRTCRAGCDERTGGPPVNEIVVAFKPKSCARARRAAAAKTRVPRRYPARIARQVALAFALRRRLERGEFDDFATMSRALGFTRARITQLMDLLLIAPEILEEIILFLELPTGAQPVSERALREALCRSVDWREQRRVWEGLQAAIVLERIAASDG